MLGAIGSGRGDARTGAARGNAGAPWVRAVGGAPLPGTVGGALGKHSTSVASFLASSRVAGFIFQLPAMQYLRSPPRSRIGRPAPREGPRGHRAQTRSGRLRACDGDSRKHARTTRNARRAAGAPHRRRRAAWWPKRTPRRPRSSLSCERTSHRACNLAHDGRGTLLASVGSTRRNFLRGDSDGLLGSDWGCFFFLVSCLEVCDRFHGPCRVVTGSVV